MLSLIKRSGKKEKVEGKKEIEVMDGEYKVMEMILVRSLIFSQLCVVLVLLLVYEVYTLLSIYIGTVVNAMLLAMMLRPTK
jgi:hypothetical protein